MWPTLMGPKSESHASRLATEKESDDAGTKLLGFLGVIDQAGDTELVVLRG